MLSLREVQERFARDILGSGDADRLIVADWLRPEQRIAIYRHHYQATLREALGLSFPVVARLVGECFFNHMADAFTARHPPSHPCLAEYGGAFPDFIAAFEPANGLPYLADVALFEWMMDEAAHDADYEGNAFYSLWPVGRIWETNQADYHGDDVVSLNDGGGWFVVERNEDGVIWRVLNLPPDAFQQSEEGRQT
jgi:hypothetical protein